MARPPLDPTPTFAQLLGRLVLPLRQQPPDEKAVRRAVTGLAALVSREPAMIEAGIENSWAVDGDPLKERLQLRQVDAILVAAGADDVELLALARALAHDSDPVPSTARVRVKLLPDPMPLQFSGPRTSVPGTPGGDLPRARTGDRLAEMIEGILRELEKAVGRGQWHAVLHDAQAAARVLPGLKEDARRTYGLALKRLLPLPVVEQLIEQGYRIPEERDRSAEVLRAAGYPAAERMLEIVRRSETIGPRAFLVDALGGMPEAVPLLVPLLESSRPAEARLAAELLGRLAAADGLKPLVAHAGHADDGVRHAVIDALGAYRDKAVVEPLRQALSHRSGATRARAAKVLAGRGSGAIAMLLLAALEQEKDEGVWQEQLRALAGIDAPEAAAALTRLALARAPRFSFGGGARLKRQLAVIAVLAESRTAAARQALQQIAAAEQGEVSQKAGEALGTGDRGSGFGD